jgi:hypothetical protein
MRLGLGPGDRRRHEVRRGRAADRQIGGGTGETGTTAAGTLLGGGGTDEGEIAAGDATVHVGKPDDGAGLELGDG